MKTPIETTLTLELVAEHFEQWRRRKKKGERIPEHLWSEAIELLGRYGISQVTRKLRLSGTDLNKRRGLSDAGRLRKGTEADAAFVEIDRTEVAKASGLQATAAWLELQRPDGLRLRIQPANGTDTLALMARFMEV